MINLPPSVFAVEDVGAWPYSVGILVECVAFLGTLHWPADAGERLVLEKAFPRYRRPGRPILVQAFFFFWSRH